MCIRDRFLENGNFSRANFDAFARSNGFIPSDYLERIREDLKSNIWRLSLLNSSFITDLEVKNSINLAEQERDISFIKFPMSDFRNSLEYREEDLSDYYNSNSNSYIDPQQVKVTYIQIDRDSLIDEGNVSEEAIRTSYEDYLSDFDDTIRKSVSHIMINIDQDRTLEEATLALINAKKKIDSGTSFEDLGIEMSEDEGTKELGGSLGITDGTLLPPEFELALVKMSTGEVSEPISLLSSVHLIKLDDQEIPSPLSFEERSKTIIEKLASENAEDEYFSILDQVSELSFSATDLQAISELIPFSIIETNFFSEGNVPEILNKANIKDFVFNLSEEGDYPELFEFEGLISTLVQVKASKPQTQLSLEESMTEVTEDFVNDLGNETLVYKTKKYGIPCERKFAVSYTHLTLPTKA